MLISRKHAALYRDYYAGRTIPLKPSVWLARVQALADRVGARTILDYGAGPGRGIAAFASVRFEVAEYDPGVAERATEPTPADLVVCIHTLEHVEPRYIDAVLAHLKSLARRALFVVVSTEASTKVLPDGTPWHTFVRPVDWWRTKLDGFVPEPTIKRPELEYAALWMVPNGPDDNAESPE